MKKNKLLLTALAVILAMGVMVAPALAYFTAHTEATGSIPIEFGSKTTLKEDPYKEGDNWGKRITVTNDGPESCYVRVQAFSSERLETTPSGAWIDGGDGWWYYDGVVDAGQSTDVLDIAIKDKSKEEIVEGQIVDVAVVYESVRVVYDKDGKPDPAKAQDADWNPTPAEGSGN